MSNASENSVGPVLRAVSQLQPHPQAEVVPGMPEEEFAGFRADVRRRGVLVPLEVNQAGLVLDGRQRLRAAGESGIREVLVRVVTPVDELDYMLRAAVMRRQLEPSQRAALAVELLEFKELREQAQQRQLANLKQTQAEVASLPPGAEVAALPPRGKTREC